MNLKPKKRITAILLSLLCTLLLATPVFAATLAGNIDSVDAEGVKGWAWNSESWDEAVTVEFHIFTDDSKTETKIITAAANSYNAQLSKDIGDGYHYFNTRINWSELIGTTFTVQAYAVSGKEKMLLPGPSQYQKSETIIPKNLYPETSTSGPGALETEAAKHDTMEAILETTGTKGESLGIFNTTAYCSCSKCSSGFNKTFSGTTPKSKHTISADLNLFPLGTKLMIGDIIYTVEDKGSSVKGKKLDIFFDSHAEALNYGLKKVEVFAVN